MDRVEGTTESLIVFRRLRRKYGVPKKKGGLGHDDNSSKPFTAGRDPQLVGTLLGELSLAPGWNENLTRARIISEWADQVGQNVAEHTMPVFEGSTLVVYCETTAWASSLRVMRGAIIGKLQDAYPGIRVEDIRLKGPDAPSWKKGIRSVPGRGPRDTYG